MINFEEIKESNYSLFGKGCKIVGNLHLTGNVHIFSEIEGDITHSGSSTLILEFNSQIRGTLTGSDIIIMGTFDGKIQASGKVIIQPTAKVRGEIKCLSLIVQPGAIIEIKGDASQT